MNNIPLWATIVIAILGSGTVGGIAGAISSTSAAKQKIKELELAYRHTEEEKYHNNVSFHVQSLYIPINKSTSNLINEFNKYKRIRQKINQAEIDFRQVCEKFVNQMLEIYEEGMDVYLTDEVDEQLRNFTFFIRDSIDYPNKSSIFTSVKYLYNHISIRIFNITHILGKRRRSLTYAPLSSKSFDNYLNDEGGQLKDLIREVTLKYSASNPLKSS
jgi:hypothetical protein